jgi:NAD(P)-dependent dehydrogenase (short-subunit alcohol dehydrogenase family)
MEAALCTVTERLGPINGVIHAAGVAGKGIIPLKTPQEAARVLAPKVSGTVILADLLAAQPLDFFVLCSSLNAIVCTAGQVDYCAANAFMDAFAQYQAMRGSTPFISINWSRWQNTGMANFVQSSPHQEHSLPTEDMLAEEGRELFARILHGSSPQVIVSAYDFPALVEQNRTAAFLPAEQLLDDEDEASTGYARPFLSTELVVPRNETEAALASIWRSVLGFAEVGVYDNFFDLGGDSLQALQIVTFASAIGLPFTVKQLLEERVIANLASIIVDAHPAPVSYDKDMA